MFDFLGGITTKVREDIDRIDRALGATPYRWRVMFITTGEIAERERAFGSPERALYNAQDYLLSRVRSKLNNTSDTVGVSITNIRSGEQIAIVGRRPLGEINQRPIGYWIAEHLGHEVE